MIKAKQVDKRLNEIKVKYLDILFISSYRSAKGYFRASINYFVSILGLEKLIRYQINIKEYERKA